MSQDTQPMSDPDIPPGVPWEIRFLFHIWGEKLVELKLRAAHCFGQEPHSQLEGRIIQLEKCLNQLWDAAHMNPVNTKTEFGGLN